MRFDLAKAIGLQRKETPKEIREYIEANYNDNGSEGYWRKAIEIPLGNRFKATFLFLFGTWILGEFNNEYHTEGQVKVSERHIDKFLDEGFKEVFTNHKDLGEDELDFLKFLAEGLEGAIFF
jgi:hypothetical protein